MTDKGCLELVEKVALPTHYCVVCAARWFNNTDGSWTLATDDCGPCCNNAPMDSAPIVKILPDGSVDGRDYRTVRSAYDAAQRKVLLGRYRGISCALCDEPFERHSGDWSCPKRVVPRFKFPAETASAATPLVKMREALGHSRGAISSLPEGALGWHEPQHEEDVIWPLRDELLHMIDTALESV